MCILRSRRRKGVGDSREEGKRGGEQTNKQKNKKDWKKRKKKNEPGVHVERPLASALLADWVVLTRIQRYVSNQENNRTFDGNEPKLNTFHRLKEHMHAESDPDVQSSFGLWIVQNRTLMRCQSSWYRLDLIAITKFPHKQKFTKILIIRSNIK